MKTFRSIRNVSMVMELGTTQSLSCSLVVLLDCYCDNKLREHLSSVIHDNLGMNLPCLALRVSPR